MKFLQSYNLTTSEAKSFLLTEKIIVEIKQKIQLDG